MVVRVHQVEMAEDSLHVLDAGPLHSPPSVILDSAFGARQLQPRVGDKYQVEIPPLTTESRHQSVADDKLDIDIPVHFTLPIPFMWAKNITDYAKCEDGAHLSNCAQADVNASLNSQEVHVNTTVNGSSNSRGLPLLVPEIFMLDEKLGAYNFHPLPGISGDCWSDLEQDCFLLGLFIFGKNMAQIQRLIGSKDMGGMLSYYYGSFYGSCKHQKWSECRKIRSRRFVHGHRLFTGCRQQELLSRLQCHIREEHKDNLTEVSRNFNDGKVSLEEYVITLKNIVGLSALVEAVGIGKGKEDLTGILMEPAKMNNFLARPEIPTGKACSSLSSTDIIRFLTGDFRLSKARSSDIFWEAVWPRLLARGWHSEQPKNHGYSKHSLVFLAPGVKKFSRRKLVKGHHYFDSVSDVLSKVASHPWLLELEADTVCQRLGSKDWDLVDQLDQMRSPHPQCHCYLQPKLSNMNQELMKFTVVDTSLICLEPYRIRELRSLPSDKADCMSPVYNSKDNDGNSSSFEEQVDERASNNHSDSPDVTFAENRPNSPDISNDKRKAELDVSLPSESGNYTCLISEKLQLCGSGVATEAEEKSIMRQFNGRMTSGTACYFRSVNKRPRLSACIKSNGSYSVVGERCHDTDSCEPFNLLPAEVGFSDQKHLTDSSSKVCAGEGSDCSMSQMELCGEKHEARTMIDLNLPHTPPDFEAEVSTEIDSWIPKQFNSNHQRGMTNALPVEEPPVSNVRRQSTRNRPLTARALEALACGFFNTKRKVRGAKVVPQVSSLPKSSRHQAVTTAKVPRLASKEACNSASSMEGLNGGLDRECSSERDFRFRVERNGTCEILAVYQPEILTGKNDISGSS